MRILAGGYCFQNTYQRGIQRYAREVLERVATHDGVDIELTAPAQAPLPRGCRTLPRLEKYPVARANLPLRAWRKFRRQFAPTRFSGHTLFHSLFFEASPEAGLPQVLTLYDMIPECFPEFFPDPGHANDKRAAMERAVKILCISEATAADAARLYPHLQDRLCVIYPGADHFMTEPAGEAVGEPDVAGVGDYVIFVGDRTLYKNFVAVVAAMSESAWPTGIALVVVGRPPSADEVELVRQHGLASRLHFKGYVPDALLRKYYRQSCGFVFSSLGEGFGFPQLEAQSLQVPVLCSDLPVFREVSGAGAIYFDPRDPASIASAVASLGSIDRDALIAAGEQNVRRFRWETCAAETMEAYRSVAGRSAALPA